MPAKTVVRTRPLESTTGPPEFPARTRPRSGVSKRVCLEHVPQVQPGDYVLVHVGFALSWIDEAEAHQVFEFLERMNALGQLDQAFQAVKLFADQFSGSQEIRSMLVDLLRATSRTTGSWPRK